MGKPDQLLWLCAGIPLIQEDEPRKGAKTQRRKSGKLFASLRLCVSQGKAVSHAKPRSRNAAGWHGLP